ncbi:oxaloacetate decarboxylase subunit alpha [Calorimonas adulescens]|uniref:Oxaloacetate decarboxylase subunit alpha n=1 Tax=Calorimonas adulescens TaxID=2606906 RepID=A0A5D8Q8W0_9THEO|nr:oxaloacetate decarboxylase subunit alpha [Calorimonas adulescens]TZE80817.1 oxaloacetate decarboxylase subunit alpha [Calorimonas adulescens]
MNEKKIGITETVLRDAHQSLLATRMSTDEMLPIAETMDKIGYHSVEMWGGATFDACLRYLNEDPWDRLRKLKKAFKNTPLQMLLRGQNLLGYKNYPDDVVTKFIYKSVDNGINIIRIFDALNDIRNLDLSIKVTKKAGAHAQATVVYTASPVHDTESFIKLAKELYNMGADSICIKDMSGILKPFDAYNLITSLKREVNIPIQLHSHYTSGMASMTYLKAIEAGVDVIDTAISPLSLGTSQPPTETFVSILQGTPYDTGLDMSLLNKIAEYFKKVRDNHMNGSSSSLISGIDTNVLIYQVPGGMLSNLVTQLSQANALDKYDKVLEEIPRVREELGYPPLVTPLSQMVGTQAVLNVITGERYKMIPNEIKDYVKGLYGKPPVPIKKEIKEKIIGDEEIIDVRPADLLKPQLDEIKKEVAEYIEQEEDILSYALFPQVALNFFKYRKAKNYNIDDNILDKENKVYPV